MSSFLVYFVLDILYLVLFTTLHLLSRSMSLFLAHIFEFTSNDWFRVLICTWERELCFGLFPHIITSSGKNHLCPTRKTMGEVVRIGSMEAENVSGEVSTLEIDW